MKKIYLLLFVVLGGVAVKAQNTPLLVQQEGGKLYLSHTVSAKENWYSIGRIYNVSPKEIAPFNGMSLENGLSIGQTLKIPLQPANFLQEGKPGADEAAVPLYHTTREKEGLFRISQVYNKVPVDQLKAWNKLSSNELASGQKLIIGYLKVKKDLSPLAKLAQGKVGAPVVKQTTTPVKTETQPPVKEVKKEVQTNPPPVVIAPVEKKKEEVKKPVENPPVVRTSGSTDTIGGAFRGLYVEQVKSNSNLGKTTGQAAIFKSTSGWKDGKYYALMNNITPGTIIKITNAANNKFIYAKVLGEIPPGRDNDGLIVRISNAAASQLQVADNRFVAELSWAKM
jgi:LysM repeat protein